MDAKLSSQFNQHNNVKGCINDEAPKNISSSLILHPSHIQTFLDTFLNTVNL